MKFKVGTRVNFTDPLSSWDEGYIIEVTMKGYKLFVKDDNYWTTEESVDKFLTLCDSYIFTLEGLL